MDFLLDQKLLFTSKRYEDIYSYFQEQDKFSKIAIHELFLLVASIGFKNNKKESFKDKGKEFRTTYFSTQQMSAIYSIILNDPKLGKQLENFNDNDYKKEAIKTLEEYAEGGMSIVCTEIFRKKWDGFKLNRDYDEYDIDILSYIYENIQEIPF